MLLFFWTITNTKIKTLELMRSWDGGGKGDSPEDIKFVLLAGPGALMFPH